MTIPLGRVQRQALTALASSPQGVTRADLGHREGHNALRRLGQHGMARVAGSRKAPQRRGRAGRVWVITPAGRHEAERLAARAAAMTRAARRLGRRAAVADILAEGIGPESPGLVKLDAAERMAKAGCRAEDVALVLACSEPEARRLMSGGAL